MTSATPIGRRRHGDQRRPAPDIRHHDEAAEQHGDEGPDTAPSRNPAIPMFRNTLARSVVHEHSTSENGPVGEVENIRDAELKCKANRPDSEQARAIKPESNNPRDKRH